MNLDELKEKAKELNLYVNKLYNEKAEILLKNDLNEFIEKNKNHIRKKNDVYYYEDFAEINIEQNTIEILIVKNLFLYNFEIDSDIKRGKIIEINEVPYSINEINNEEHCYNIKRYTDDLENSIEKLNSEGISNYTYYFQKEDLRLSNFPEVWEKITHRN